MAVAALFSVCHAMAVSEIYTLSLHDALPILFLEVLAHRAHAGRVGVTRVLVGHQGLVPGVTGHEALMRSEEHTSELQSRQYLVCRLLLEKKRRVRLSLENSAASSIQRVRPEA